MELLRDLEPEKYWSFPSGYTKEKRDYEIKQLIADGKHSYQLKTDGNYSAFVCDFDGEKRLLSRGISKTTGEYGRLENKVFWYDDVAKAFDKPTRIMGEIYIEGGVDKTVGSILRCLDWKAKAIQDTDYYHSLKGLTAAEKRSVERNQFMGQKLKWRIFDVWYYDGQSLMDMPWIERQKYVKAAATRINNPLVTYVPHYPIDETFYDKFLTLINNGEEGVVAYLNSGIPEPGKRTAHKTLKLKRELQDSLDVFITGVEKPTKEYSGGEIGSWQFWEDRTGQLIEGTYGPRYLRGEPFTPVTKNYFNHWPGAINVAVYNNLGREIPICKVAGLDENLKTELRDNFAKYDHACVSITGMALSDSNGISVRHPKLKAIRLEDMDAKDCTLDKILG